MKRNLLVLILSIGCMTKCFAQTDDADGSKKERATVQYIGAQMNPLIRQVLNFTNSTTGSVVSPYYFTYNINSRKTGWGLRAGVGYNFSSTSTNDGITAATTKINNLHARIGLEKEFVLSSKWSAGAGLDFIYVNNNNNTSSTISSFDTSTTTTKDVTIGYGGGPMAWLRYHLTEHLLIGTEASYYYTTSMDKSTIDVTKSSVDPLTGQYIPPFTTETVSKPTLNNGNTTLPITIYLIVKF